MAGFVSTAENWALFSDAWAAELRAGEPINYIKMREANSRDGEFYGWTTGILAVLGSSGSQTYKQVRHRQAQSPILALIDGSGERWVRSSWRAIAQ